MSKERLASHEVFQFLRPQQLRVISDAAEELSLPAGSTVFRQGERAEFFFAVLEGQVALRMVQSAGVSLDIDEVAPGEIFGSCICFQLDAYSLTAQCTEDSKVLKVEAGTLKRLLDEDPALGYTLQTLISRVYFKRYVETMKKLKTIVGALALKGS